MKRGFHYKIKSAVLNGLLMILIPIGTMCLTEFWTHVPQDLKPPIFLANLLIYYLVYLFFSFLWGKFGPGYVCGTVLLGIFGFANYLVVSFRSSPIVPWDLYSIRTAASVAGNYKPEFDREHIWIMLALLALMLLGSRIDISCKRKKLRLGVLLTVSILIVGYVSQIGSEKAIEMTGLDTTLFTPNAMYRKNGLVTGFLGNVKYLRVDKPKGYSEKAVREIADGYETESEAVVSEQSPNIIVIMNEAFADMSIYGEFASDHDELEYIHSLREHTIKGNCHVSIKGGNTANSEFEFLTGDTMAFLPSGSVPYQQYIKSEQPSLASYLKNAGYQTISMHPFRSDGWCRDQVYPRMGFDQMFFMSDFDGADTLRNFVTDQAAFEKIIDCYEKKEKGEKIFVFEVTMQNHGGYNKKSDDFSSEVDLTDLPDKTRKVKAAQNYLTLIGKSDQAFQMLTEYFAEQEEPTIILMFGDHQPSDYVTDTFADLNERTAEEREQLGYTVPYILWANYDMDQNAPGEISLNYLGGLLMEKAGISLDGYQKYLKKLQEIYPVITAKIMMDKDGREQKTDISLLSEYHMLEYNNLCDKKNKLWDFFGVSTAVHTHKKPETA